MTKSTSKLSPPYSVDMIWSGLLCIGLCKYRVLWNHCWLFISHPVSYSSKFLIDCPVIFTTLHYYLRTDKVYFFRKLISAYFWAWRFPKEEHFVLFFEIFSIDFPQTSMKGEVSQYIWLPPQFSSLVNVQFLSCFPSWSQLIRL